MAGKKHRFDRRTALKSGILALGAAVVPGTTQASTQSLDQQRTGYVAGATPSDEVDSTTVSYAETEEVPTGNFIDHAIFGIGGTKEAAEWWGSEAVEADLVLGDERIKNVNQNDEFTTVVQRDEVTLEDGTVIENVWGLEMNYVLNPQPPGRYSLSWEIEYLSDSPSRGSDLDPIEKGGPLIVDGAYEVVDRGRSRRND